MKYFYIICLVLSSFFIYNLSSADNIERQYAFFIPGNSYQKNTDVNNLNTMSTRYKKQVTTDKKDTSSPSAHSKANIKTAEKLSRPVTKKPLKEITDTTQTSQITTKETPSVIKQDTAINDETAIKTKATAPIPETPVSVTEQLSQEELDKIKQKAAQYNIDDDDFFITPIASETTPKEEKTINAMLSEIPYPNSDEPKFKQAFGKYGIALRTLYRQKEMPKDYEQDRILAKANSIKRFKVEAKD